MSDRACNKMGCTNIAEFEIYGDFGHPEDVTDSCEWHVGDLLGTPEWAVKMYGRESKSWTVVWIGPNKKLVPSAWNPDQTVFVEAPLDREE